MAREVTLDTVNMPTDSWWIGLSRDAFSAQAAAELSRMRRSRFGSVDVVTMGEPERKPERKREAL